VNAVILDKTGTITEGKPAITDIAWHSSAIAMQEELEEILCAIEKQSEHPLAEAVVNYLQRDKNVSVDRFESITGQGVQAQIRDIEYRVGNESYLKNAAVRIDPYLRNAADFWRSEAKTVIYFSQDKEVLAVIAIADKIKRTAAEAVKILESRGVEVHMLTGDNKETARAIAKQAGIKNYRAAILPSGKANFIKELQQEGKIVAMVGDGINDSQALAQANVSIAMGRGSDIAIDVAKMTLIGSDLLSVPKALKLSAQTVRTIRQNLFWAFIYNLVGIPLAAGVLYPVNGFLLDPMIAGAAMALSSVSVVANSLKLKWMN
jgi:Cu2+-exporting ATPase